MDLAVRAEDGEPDCDCGFGAGRRVRVRVRVRVRGEGATRVLGRFGGGDGW